MLLAMMRGLQAGGKVISLASRARRTAWRALLAFLCSLTIPSKFPEMDAFVAWQQEYAAGLERKGLHPHAADHMLNVAMFGPLVYTSVATLFSLLNSKAHFPRISNRWAEIRLS